jgi:ribosomal protein L7/L12
MAEVLALASLIVGIFAVAALLAARAREVRATARIEDLERRVEEIAAHVGMPAAAPVARAATHSQAAAPAPEEDLVALYLAGRKIEAIKGYRLETGLGLAEAKEAIERAAAHSAERGAADDPEPPAGAGKLIV